MGVGSRRLCCLAAGAFRVVGGRLSRGGSRRGGCTMWPLALRATGPACPSVLEEKVVVSDQVGREVLCVADGAVQLGARSGCSGAWPVSTGRVGGVWSQGGEPRLRVRAGRLYAAGCGSASKDRGLMDMLGAEDSYG
ncbi:unnamed protein product [Boreogadus saida]